VSAPRRVLRAVVLFLAGTLTGVAAVLTWQSVAERNTGPAALQATILVPTVDNSGRRFTEDEWQAALGLLSASFGGVTFGAEQEGWWHDARQRLHREPVRVVVVTFDRARLPAFRQAVRELGRRLGQEAMYFRLEPVHVEVLPVGEENFQKAP
jgi:hypothetical protein